MKHPSKIQAPGGYCSDMHRSALAQKSGKGHGLVVVWNVVKLQQRGHGKMNHLQVMR